MDDRRNIEKRLGDVLSSIQKIESFVETRPKRFDVFCQDEMYRCAVLFNIAIIGEAIGQILKISPEIRITSSRQIVNTRNYIIHGYDSLDNEILWSIVINHIPKLKQEVLMLLDQ
ncbi:DUF86 domain-containing protein [uncultured Duncaniella sp.]|uniref:HepT-like ribonuclease domain-containing protein n=1 Tax=uncultured Duncaniella sp. TaxID=2768039 RepID=UPI002674E0CE|nr:HepT-like ribonuclease domain-containing protein [uncultured Duncaniella sp.]MCI9172955.1 DUF86 domain-containing protein [Muribaculaceae bacterium]